MPRFQVYILSFSRSFGSVWEYATETEQEVRADARVSQAMTTRGPEGTIDAEFRLSASDEDEAVETGHEVFRAALLKAGAPADKPDWKIEVGATLIDEATDRPVQPAASIILNLSREIRMLVTWDDLQALQRRLEYIEETHNIRDTLWEPYGNERVVLLAERQVAPFLHALEDWSDDRDADEAMPQNLVPLQHTLARLLRGL